MTTQTHPVREAESLRFFARTRRIVGWLVVACGFATFFSLFRSPSSAIFPALFLILLYGIWLFMVLVEKREAFRVEGEPEPIARREIAAESAELRTAIGIGIVILIASVLVVGVALGSKWLGTVALLLFLYLLVIGGPFWLAEILARGEDARHRPR